MCYAARDGKAKVVKLLLERGADPLLTARQAPVPQEALESARQKPLPRHGVNALMLASCYEHEAVVRLLLRQWAGRAIDARCSDGLTALWYAGCDEVAYELIKAGADYKLRDGQGRDFVEVHDSYDFWSFGNPAENSLW